MTFIYIYIYIYIPFFFYDWTTCPLSNPIKNTKNHFPLKLFYKTDLPVYVGIMQLQTS